MTLFRILIIFVLGILPGSLSAKTSTSGSNKISEKRQVVSDNRLLQTNVLPKPGLGYDTASNRVFSKCLGGNPFSRPTFDFNSTQRLVDPSYLAMLRADPIRPNRILLRFLKSRENGEHLQPQPGKKRFTGLIWLLVEKHATGFEGQLKIIRPLQRALAIGRLSYFYSRCGTQLIHDMTSFASYHVMLRYDAEDQEDAKKLFAAIKLYLRGIQPKPSDKLTAELKKRQTMMRVEAIGLQALAEQSRPGDLIPVNLPGLKKSIADMDTHMASAAYGSPSSIALTNWLNLADFYSTLPAAISDSLLEEQNRLHHRENSSRVALLSGYLDLAIQQQASLKLCRQQLFEDFADFPDSTLAEHRNHPESPEQALSFGELRQSFSPEFMEKLADSVLRMQTTRLSCYESLDKNDFHGISHTQIAECDQNLRLQLEPVKKLLNYCPVQIVFPR